MVPGLLSLELKRLMEKLKDNNTTTQVHQQRTITTLFRPITHHGASQSRATQVGFQPRHCGGITIDPTLTI